MWPDVDNLAYLLEFDTVYGRYHRELNTADGALVVDGRRIAAFAEHDPAQLPWADLGVDLVLECTGVFKTDDSLKTHDDRKPFDSGVFGHDLDVDAKAGAVFDHGCLESGVHPGLGQGGMVCGRFVEQVSTDGVVADAGGGDDHGEQ